MPGELHSQSGHNEEEKNLLTLLGIKLQFLSHPVWQLSYPTFSLKCLVFFDAFKMLHSTIYVSYLKLQF